MNKVNECIDNLEQQIRWIEDIDVHKFAGWGHTVDAMRQAVVLLKAQEPMEPSIGGDADGMHGSWWHTCGACHEQIDRGDKFCRLCGRPVKWE